MNLPQGWELILLVLVVVLLFGAKKLPEAARGVGRSLRIFKAEVKQTNEPLDDEDRPAAAAAPPAIAPAPVQPYQPVAPSAERTPVADPAAPPPAQQTSINGEPVPEPGRTER